MSFFELYRTNVPLFFPSIELLTKWELGTLATTLKLSIPPLANATTQRMHIARAACNMHMRMRMHL